MEPLGVIIFIGWAIWAAISALESSADNQNYDKSNSNIENLKIRFKKDTIEGNEVKQIQVKGLIPYTERYSADLSINTYLEDVTEDLDNKQEKYFVFSLMENFQRSGSMAFEFKSKQPNVSYGTYFPDWATIAIVPFKILVPPKKGKRKIKPLIVIENENNGIEIWNSISRAGFNRTFVYENLSSGYLDFDENRKKSYDLSIKLAVSVSMSDGSLDDSEGFVIKKWMKKTVDSFEDEDTRTSTKNLLNKSFKESHLDAKNGKLSLSDIVNELNDAGDERNKYEAIELCYDVMTADGKAEQGELDMIESIIKSLGLNSKEISNIRDTKMKDLDQDNLKSSKIEDLLNIDTSQSKEKIRKDLTKEFSKWNSRLNSLEEGKDRDNAQKMIDLISEARKKYK
tara:strand:+ start:2010 stop:3203 length:1194 start_codon:yes stop_codon:yes gene_type:complete